MSFESVSPNMMLPIPGVGLTDGPQWAEDINNSLTLVDSHDHSAGQGVQITAAGININTDFPINGNNLTLIRSLRLFPQNAPLSLPADLGCLYESGVDLYYNDGNGNQVRITQAGSVTGASGSITGLVTPASASYVSGSGTFVWQQAVNTAASLDAASVIIRKTTASSPGITLAAPVGLSSDYTATLPAAPPTTTSVVSMDSSGNLLVGGSSSVNYVVSPPCVAFSPSSASTFEDVTNLSVTITTNGRPVMIFMQSDGNINGFIELESLVDNAIRITRDGVPISTQFISAGGTAPSGFILTQPFPGTFLDVGATAGSHTYKIQFLSGSSPGTAAILHAVLAVINY